MFYNQCIVTQKKSLAVESLDLLLLEPPSPSYPHFLHHNESFISIEVPLLLSRFCYLHCFIVLVMSTHYRCVYVCGREFMIRKKVSQIEFSAIFFVLGTRKGRKIGGKISQKKSGVNTYTMQEEVGGVKTKQTGKDVVE